jgi:quercetin dioxygenase-like cupin family protein
MSDITLEIYHADVKELAVFAADGPKPHVLIDAPRLKAMLIGLEAGQHIPIHPEQAALYHFLEGEGLMTIDEETYRVAPGVTVAAPDGAPRGMNARTRLVFLACKGGA